MSSPDRVALPALPAALLDPRPVVGERQVEPTPVARDAGVGSNANSNAGSSDARVWAVVSRDGAVTQQRDILPVEAMTATTDVTTCCLR